MRTCRKVRAHRREAQGSGNRTPAQKKHDRINVTMPKGKKDTIQACAAAQGEVEEYYPSVPLDSLISFVP